MDTLPAFDYLNDPGIVTVVQIAPAVRGGHIGFLTKKCEEIYKGEIKCKRLITTRLASPMIL